MNMKDDELEDVSPYYIIFAFDKNLSLRADIIKKSMKTRKFTIFQY